MERRVNPDHLKIISTDTTDIKGRGYLNFGCALKVHLTTDADLSKATHSHEFLSWEWVNVKQLPWDDIFPPCIPTLKSFIQEELQNR